ncbi:MAG: AAA family ATPase, partial [Oscillospiraceae bacterium]|jgi:ABC-2 type transport system ATP-binding protein|nr:AAA family ATPase [Oscillospiraceae bacterium]
VYGAMYRLSAAETQRRILQFAALLKLTQDDLSKQSRALSLGQRMKGELCLSFINEPTVIFLDEPTLGLDLPSTRAIRRFLKQYCVEHNAAIILTSHDLGDIAQTSTDLLIINAGEQVFYGGINELPNHFEKRTRIRYEVTAPDAAEKICEKIPNTTFIGLEATTLCQTAQVNDTLNALYQLSAILNLRMEETPFEDMIEDILHEG